MCSYGTEPAVGKAIKQSGVPRAEIFVTTKLWNNRHHPEDVELALQESLDDLGLKYVDLFMMHWPVAFKRGDDMFPSDENGRLLTEDIDYLDVSSAFREHQDRIIKLTRLDLPSDGSSTSNWKSKSYWHQQLFEEAGPAHY